VLPNLIYKLANFAHRKGLEQGALITKLGVIDLSYFAARLNVLGSRLLFSFQLFLSIVGRF